MIGGLGIVTTIAPLPGTDIADSPHVFEAETLAKMLSPRAQLYGAAWSTRSGTVQVRSLTSEAHLPSQLSSCSE